MKNRFAIVAGLLMVSTFSYAQTNEVEGVSIANDETPPSRDAVLDVVSATKGMLVPRVDYSEIDPNGTGKLHWDNVHQLGQDGLLVFVTNDDDNLYGYWYFDERQEEWLKLSSTGGSGGASLWTKNADPDDDIYNTGFASNDVGIGIQNPAAKLNVSTNENNIFIAEGNRTLLGHYKWHPSLGPVNYLRQESKNTLNTVYQQVDETGVGRLSLVTVYNWNGNERRGWLDFDDDDAFVSNISGNLGITAANHLYLQSGGDIYANGGVLVSSDTLLKTNVTALGTGHLARLINLVGYTYRYNSPGYSTGTQYGLIAQNVQRYYPALVKTFESEVVTSDSTSTDSTYLSLDYRGLIPIIIESIKELNTKVNSLEAELNQLQSDYATLEQRVDALENP